MIVLEESSCRECKWTNSCMIFKKLQGIGDNRFKEDSHHKNDVIEIIVRKCSVKNIDRSYRIRG